MINQQFWLWGLDIRRPEGNALIEYGFSRAKPPEGQKGSNTYSLCRADGVSVILWAFGFFYHRAGIGGIFVPRFHFTPRLARFAGLPGEVWSATQLTTCRVPHGAQQWARARCLLIPALRWIADYERWVLEARSLAYRRACVADWRHTQVAADRLLEAWEGLAGDCDAAMGTFIAARAQAQPTPRPT